MWMIKMTKNKIAALIGSIAFVQVMYGGVFDNRFFPSLYPRIIMRSLDESSLKVTADTFFMVANRAHGDEAVEKKGVPEIYGAFDLVKMGTATTALGFENPLRASWQIRSSTILWDVQGKVQAAGSGLRFEKKLTKHVSCGGMASIMHVSSYQKFSLSQDSARSLGIVSQSDKNEIDDDRRTMLQNCGFTETGFKGAGFSDSLVYLRIGGGREYIAKFRQALIGLTIGALLPTGKQRITRNPSSVPFGADGHRGFLVGFDTYLELKEDMWFGFATYLSNRFEKDEIRRLPLAAEPEIFGAVEGKVKVDPGVSFLFAPSLTMNDVQNGFGLQLQYVYGFHQGDVWRDRRDDQTIATDFSKIYATTKWRTEYLFLSLFYEHARIKPTIRCNPVVALTADFPINFIGPEFIAKTYRVAVSLSIDF